MLIGSFTVSAQCNDELVNQCALQAGDGYMYINNFKVRLEKQKKGKPAPIAKFSVVLKKDVVYRFNICNAKEFDGQAVLQLFDTEKMIASNVNMSSGKIYPGFDFICKKSSIYYVVMSFMEGKEGCSVGMVSMAMGK